MKKIYIITTHTGTIVSRLIKKKLDVPYTHVSISIEEDLQKMYSLGRKYVMTPIIAGLVEENINKGLYKIKTNTICRVYSINVSIEQYELVKQNIKKQLSNKRNIKYDFMGVITSSLDKQIYKKDTFVCSTFVAHILKSSNIDIFKKPPYLITPLDFYNSSKLNLEYEGLLNQYNYTKTKETIKTIGTKCN